MNQAKLKTNLIGLPVVIVSAMAITLALFALMAKLISGQQQPVIIHTETPTVLNHLDMTEVNVDKPHPKTKIEPYNKTPPPPRETVNINQDSTAAKPQITAPNIELALGGNFTTGGQNQVSNPFVSGQTGMSDSDATPMIRITPRYPIEAAKQGIEGWVKLSFTINPDGSVGDIKVIDAKPKRLFNKAAKKALKGWRYKAKFVDAVAVAQYGMQVQLDFELEK